MAEGLYYTQQLYLDRFGAEEAERVTADDNGDIDPLAFERAIADVSADMDLYLSGRYALPFAEPLPRALVSIAAALVREKLHGSFPTETVTMEADRARSTLKDIARGTGNLLVDTGEPVASAESGADSILISAPPRVFTAERLRNF